MSRHGGKRDGAGRPAGAVTKRSREMAENASKDGITPLEYMLRVLRDETAESEQRMWAAEKAAPYVHPRLSAIEHGGSLNITNHEDALDELDES